MFTLLGKTYIKIDPIVCQESSKGLSSKGSCYGCEAPLMLCETKECISDHWSWGDFIYKEIMINEQSEVM